MVLVSKLIIKGVDVNSTKATNKRTGKSFIFRKVKEINPGDCFGCCFCGGKCSGNNEKFIAKLKRKLNEQRKD